MMKNERGFTIMELMVVIVIIGVLAAIGVPAYQNMTERARQTACAANRKTINTLAAMYFADRGEFPEDGAITTDVVKLWAPDGEDAEAYAGNITNLECPSGGAYTLTDGVVTCDQASHQ